MTRRRATDLIYFLTSPESYRSLVIGSGWTTRRWVRWVSDTLSRELFGDSTPGHGGDG